MIVKRKKYINDILKLLLVFFFLNESSYSIKWRIRYRRATSSTTPRDWTGNKRLVARRLQDYTTYCQTIKLWRWSHHFLWMLIIAIRAVPELDGDAYRKGPYAIYSKRSYIIREQACVYGYVAEKKETFWTRSKISFC